MFSIAIVARKGGPGKTTTAVNIVGAAIRKDKSVGVVDLDPQGTLSEWCNARYHTAGISDAPYTLNIEGNALKSGLAEAEQAGFDYVVIDTPPAIGGNLDEVTAAVDLVLVVCKPSKADLDAISATLSTVQASGTPYAFVVSMAKRGTNLLTQAQTLLSQAGPIAGVVHDRIAFAEMLSPGQTIYEYDPSGKGTYDVNTIWQFITKFEANNGK